MIRIQTEDFDVSEEMKRLTQGPAIGAVASFVGLVRGGSGSGAITAMTLEHYPGMTERALEAIEAEACKRFSLTASLIIHRVGRLLPGAQIVLVMAAAPHRGDAFQATEFMMDYLKTDAPFWKCEETPQGAAWVEARDSDDSAKARWSRERPKSC